ncbi:hypothetical protein C7K43_01120 [Tetragenococcus koreensis]|nr:hypothetical protein C7K43_01120 [Tetragenococcus koreensis]
MKIDCTSIGNELLIEELICVCIFNEKQAMQSVNFYQIDCSLCLFCEIIQKQTKKVENEWTNK